MKELHEFIEGEAGLISIKYNKNIVEITVLLLNAEEIMTDAMRLLSTAKAGQDANELAARMNEWVEAWNE